MMRYYVVAAAHPRPLPVTPADFLFLGYSLPELQVQAAVPRLPGDETTRLAQAQHCVCLQLSRGTWRHRVRLHDDA